MEGAAAAESGEGCAVVLPPSAERREEEAADLGVGVRFLPALPYEAYILLCLYIR